VKKGALIKMPNAISIIICTLTNEQLHATAVGKLIPKKRHQIEIALSFYVDWILLCASDEPKEIIT
jgi:hypothetical protein